MNQKKVKKIETLDINSTILFKCTILISLLLISVLGFFLYESILKNTFSWVIIIIMSTSLLLPLCLYLILLKKYPTIKYYDEGFTVGNEKDINTYSDLEYFYTKNKNKILENKFLSIIYKSKTGSWKEIKIKRYRKTAFDLFQEDYLKSNYNRILKSIQRGNSESFYVVNQKKLKKVVAKSNKSNSISNVKELLKTSERLIITSEYIIISNGMYKWNDYRVYQSISGTIILKDLRDNTLKVIEKDFSLHRENLLSALIEKFNVN